MSPITPDLREEIKLEQNFEEVIGESQALKDVLFKLEQVAPTNTTVLILGESGTWTAAAMKEYRSHFRPPLAPRTLCYLLKGDC